MERKTRSKSKEYKSVNEVFEDNTNPSERENARKFRKMYQGVRKALVFIAKNRSEKGNNWAVDQSIETLEKGLELLN